MAYAIECDGLTRDFGALRAVDGLDLRVRAGRVFGFLGPNGAGKTTTLHMLLGILRPSAGTARVADADVATEADLVRRRCGALLEHHGLYERLSALENLEFQGRVHRMAAPDRAARAKELLDEMGLWERRHEPVGTWSKGMKQQLAIARSLLHGPQVLFLDEPTAGHDPAAAALLRKRMRELARDGMTVFLTTHNLHEAETVCDEVAVIRRGRTLAVGPPGQLRGKTGLQLEVRGGPFPRAALDALRARKDVEACEARDGHLHVSLRGKGSAAPIVRALVESGVRVEEVRHVRASLEAEFLELVQADGETAQASGAGASDAPVEVAP